MKDLLEGTFALILAREVYGLVAGLLDLEVWLEIRSATAPCLRLRRAYVDRVVRSVVGQAQRGLNGSSVRDTDGVVVDPPDVVVAIDAGTERRGRCDGVILEPRVGGLIDTAADERGSEGGGSGGDGCHEIESRPSKRGAEHGGSPWRFVEDAARECGGFSQSGRDVVDRLRDLYI
jgi:hypothetical protein